MPRNPHRNIPLFLFFCLRTQLLNAGRNSIYCMQYVSCFVMYRSEIADWRFRCSQLTSVRNRFPLIFSGYCLSATFALCTWYLCLHTILERSLPSFIIIWRIKYYFCFSFFWGSACDKDEVATRDSKTCVVRGTADNVEISMKCHITIKFINKSVLTVFKLSKVILLFRRNGSSWNWFLSEQIETSWASAISVYRMMVHLVLNLQGWLVSLMFVTKSYNAS